MTNPIDTRIDILEHADRFSVEKLTERSDVSSFSCEYRNFTDFLKSNAFDLDRCGIATTYLIKEIATQKICAFYTILPGTVKINRATKQSFFSDKQDIPPIVDIAGTVHIHHLAADKDFSAQYKHIIRFITNILKHQIITKIDEHMHVSYITLDADIDTDEDLVEKYEHSGFTEIPNMQGEDEGTLPLMITFIYDN